ncbi:MAG: hypothetical protein II049_01195 [Clostridia bacterium]|nr:hypothetical protein [Clostridia bacterium]
MATQKTIPIVVGVTGHRNIRSEDRDALYGAVVRTLSELQSRCPHSELLMLNALAEGADQLCAEAAEALSIPLVAALPMEQAEYERDFSGDSKQALYRYCDSARECFVVPAIEQTPPSPDRDFAYRQAGVYAATHAHVLLALWDGKPLPEKTCGTAETVRFALEQAYDPKGSIPLSGCPVLHIMTPREASEPQEAGTVRFLGDRSAFDEILQRTDEFNRLAVGAPSSSSPLLPQDREPDAKLDRMEALYAEADALSIRFATQYRRILAALAVISTVITVAFLLYDEADLHWMILLCGLMLLAAWLVQRRGSRIACHRRYLEYRTLAESLRVQAFLRYAGSRIRVADILPWSELEDAAWIAAALRIIPICGKPYGAHSVRKPWVEDQIAYHLRAGRKSERARAGSERIVGIALFVSIALYLLVLLFELVWGDLLPASLRIANADLYRMLSKLLLGGISAATLFISNYYGRLSLSRAASDHRKMAQFYTAILSRIDRSGETEDLLLLLAREELIENGNWCSYRRDNAADFNL